MNVEPSDGELRQTAPFWAALGAGLSLAVGPVGFLLTLGATAYILRNGTYLPARQACGIVSCFVALVLAAGWSYLVIIGGSAI